MNSRGFFVSSLVGLLIVVCGGPVFAVHKSWLLKNGGNQCVFTEPSMYSDDRRDGFIWNNGTSDRFVSCPVAVSGRWASSNGPALNPSQSWANVLAANVYVRNATAGQSLYCTMQARLGSGSQLDFLSFSRTATTTAAGDKQLIVAYDGNWGTNSSLEQNQALTIRSLDFQCFIPKYNNGLSGVYGYKVKTCMDPSFPECHTASTGVSNGNDSVFPSDHTISGLGTGTNYVQTSGIECNSSSIYAERGDFGIRSNSGTIDVYCPLTPPSDDSNENNRQVMVTSVYYKGGNNNADCVTAGTCPTCQIISRDRSTGVTSWSPTLRRSEFVSPSTYVQQFSTITIGAEVSTVVWCVLPQGQTIQGATARMTVNQVVQAL
jgi:hypothetical protein